MKDSQIGFDPEIEDLRRKLNRLAAEPQNPSSLKKAELALFNITAEQELRLRYQAKELKPAPVIKQPKTFDEYVKQHEIPYEVMEMSRLTKDVSLSAWEQEAIRYSLNHGHLSERETAQDKKSYIRVDCFGVDEKSPCVLEIWPGGHYSPIHEHAGSTGIIKGLVGRVDIMLYEQLYWKAKKLGMLTLTSGHISWLSESYGKRRYQIHQVYCPMAEDDYAATFHIYNNWQKETFGYCPHEPTEDESECQKEFITVSHYHWNELREKFMQETPYYE